MRTSPKTELAPSSPTRPPRFNAPTHRAFLSRIGALGALPLLAGWVHAADDLQDVTRELQQRLAAAESEISIGLVVVWLLTGAVVGTVAGILFARKRSGFGGLTNLLIGLCGAGLGGMLFNSLDIHFNWGAFVIHYQDLFSAFVGSVILLTLVSLIKNRKGSGAAKSAKR